MSAILPDFNPSAIQQMLTFGLGIVQAHSVLLAWLAGILLFVFVFTYLVNEVHR